VARPLQLLRVPRVPGSRLSPRVSGQFLLERVPVDSADPPLIRRRALEELLHALSAPEIRGVLLLGAAGTGKTSLLRMAKRDLDAQGRAVFFVGQLGVRDPGDLGDRIVEAMEASRFRKVVKGRRTIRSSAGAPRLGDVTTLLSSAGRRLPSPVLLLDGLDESSYPLRMAAAVEELIAALEEWKIVVSSRPVGVAPIGRFTQFRVLRLGGFDQAEVERFLEAYVPNAPTSAIHELVRRAEGNPLFLRLLADELLRSGSVDVPAEVQLGPMVERLVARAIGTSPDPLKLTTLLEQLALAGGRDRILSIAAKSHMSEEEARRLLSVAGLHGLVQVDAAEVGIIHVLIRDLILARRILAPRFRLVDLAFGSEEAERDELLDESFVPRPSLTRILEERRSIIVGDRGSGKSAIFRRLAAGDVERAERRPVTVCPVADSAELLHRMVGVDGGLDAEALRAAWLVIVASVVATEVPPPAPKRIRRSAANFRAALGVAAEHRSLGRRLLTAAAQPFAGTTVKFAVGPVNLEVQLPAGSAKTTRGPVDVEAFLREADDYFSAVPRRVVVMFDRIDEMFKYDRVKQEALVQALMQAEGRVSIFQSIGLIVFIRTDLFELYDIQEKTKLVSRTLTLEWSEEEWLQLLINRVFVNRSVEQLANSFGSAKGPVELRAALEALFPSQVEGQPIDRWLIDSVRNGNGDISPRLAVVFLHLARDLSPNAEAEVSTLPLFSTDAVRGAMTKLSDLSYSEVINDFKVARSFVQNCRVGKLASFVSSEVEELFDLAEGTISEQVGLLERLGFLERVVRVDDSGTTSLFRIPRLYTRCWDYA
jgi:GTPase SAR1 family protein